MNNTIRDTLVVLSCLSATACAPPAPQPLVELAPTAECFSTLAEALSTDEMEGRGIGTAGIDKAAELIATHFRALGLEDPLKDYRQPFQATVGVELGEGNRLSFSGTEAVIEQDFLPLGFSSSAKFSGELVFAGYGIRAEELGYDDYAGVDVEGKVVLAMRFEPGETDENSPFEGKRPSRWSDLRYKALIAREAGAAALILVDPPRESGGDEPDKLPPLRSMGPLARAGIPVLQITRTLADRWLAAAGTSLEQTVQAIDADYAPRSVALAGLMVEGAADVLPVEATLNNVVGLLPGAGALKDEVVVLGAHYDHLGFGGRGSMQPNSTEIHNGADDNASGVAAMLCALGGLGDALPNGDNRRTLLAAAFAAEEIGLGGSGYYVRHPVRPIESTVSMVNLDMVGRVREEKLQAMGTDSGEGWEEILQPIAEEVGLELSMGGDGYGPSDQMSFYEQGIPVVHLFSGAHEEYHTPADDAHLLNAEGGAQVAGLVRGVMESLATRPERVSYLASTGQSAMLGDSRGYGAYLGTIPDYTEMMEGKQGDGVLLAGVRGGGPADLAGIRKGDRIVEIAGMQIQNLYDMTFALRDNRPGESVTVVVVRDGEQVELLATLGDRSKIRISADSPHGAADQD